MSNNNSTSKDKKPELEQHKFSSSFHIFNLDLYSKELVNLENKMVEEINKYNNNKGILDEQPINLQQFIRIFQEKPYQPNDKLFKILILGQDEQEEKDFLSNLSQIYNGQKNGQINDQNDTLNFNFKENQIEIITSKGFKYNQPGLKKQDSKKQTIQNLIQTLLYQENSQKNTNNISSILFLNNQILQGLQIKDNKKQQQNKDEELSQELLELDENKKIGKPQQEYLPDKIKPKEKEIILQQDDELNKLKVDLEFHKKQQIQDKLFKEMENYVKEEFKNIDNLQQIQRKLEKLNDLKQIQKQDQTIKQEEESLENKLNGLKKNYQNLKQKRDIIKKELDETQKYMILQNKDNLILKLEKNIATYQLELDIIDNNYQKLNIKEKQQQLRAQLKQNLDEHQQIFKESTNYSGKDAIESKQKYEKTKNELNLKFNNYDIEKKEIDEKLNKISKQLQEIQKSNGQFDKIGYKNKIDSQNSINDPKTNPSLKNDALTEINNIDKTLNPYENNIQQIQKYKDDDNNVHEKTKQPQQMVENQQYKMENNNKDYSRDNVSQRQNLKDYNKGEQQDNKSQKLRSGTQSPRLIIPQQDKQEEIIKQYFEELNSKEINDKVLQDALILFDSSEIFNNSYLLVQSEEQEIEIDQIEDVERERIKGESEFYLNKVNRYYNNKLKIFCLDELSNCIFSSHVYNEVDDKKSNPQNNSSEQFQNKQNQPSSEKYGDQINNQQAENTSQIQDNQRLIDQSQRFTQKEDENFQISTEEKANRVIHQTKKCKGGQINQIHQDNIMLNQKKRRKIERKFTDQLLEKLIEIGKNKDQRLDIEKKFDEIRQSYKKRECQFEQYLLRCQEIESSIRLAQYQKFNDKLSKIRGRILELKKKKEQSNIDQQLMILSIKEYIEKKAK